MEDGGRDILQAASAGLERAQEEVDAAPRLTDAFHLQCFIELGTTRQTPMGEVPINIQTINWYASDHLGLSLLQAEAFEYVIRAVDVAYLNKQAEKRDKASKRGK